MKKKPKLVRYHFERVVLKLADFPGSGGESVFTPPRASITVYTNREIKENFAFRLKLDFSGRDGGKRGKAKKHEIIVSLVGIFLVPGGIGNRNDRLKIIRNSIIPMLYEVATKHTEGILRHSLFRGMVWPPKQEIKISSNR